MQCCSNTARLLPSCAMSMHGAGSTASQLPCEALLRLAAAALEVPATVGRPRLDLVPLFPTAGWGDLAAGKLVLDDAP